MVFLGNLKWGLNKTSLGVGKLGVWYLLRSARDVFEQNVFMQHTRNAVFKIDFEKILQL